ncbi:unnamed protein product [Vicia faba]|uniref:Uncharacterized protein n=1 Tax=Vicia faba TaxID=3906 RepID=A0AAV1A6Q3_VICFA|nr:unnamed protein product [Vicia faba]
MFQLSNTFNFSGLVRLATLDLGNNRFTGVLPPTLYDCKSLAALRLASIRLRDRILTGLKKLSTLMLSKNFYYEVMNMIEPDGFRNIQVLGLGGCSFIGQIPSWLKNLMKLEALDLPFNQFNGSIPPCFEGNSQLCGLVIQRPCSPQRNTTSTSARAFQDFFIVYIVIVSFVIQIYFFVTFLSYVS